ncbi:hypothetical protein AVEN_46137-1 [Araneus ventricosus]|uniref:Uncharacterized protein n=1 Tax=Araneus ventricosus TaxID=182803 RepID=A0A4Y2D943_ARAVE|nr:hypothetical protein AVEN_46137-1 [Araneus ventricosus]
MAEKDTLCSGYSGIHVRGYEYIEPFQSSKFMNCINVSAYQSTPTSPTFCDDETNLCNGSLSASDGDVTTCMGSITLHLQHIDEA